MADNLQITGDLTCPYLGLLLDPATSLTYPSAESYCHNTQPPAVPRLDHQIVYCLTKGYSSCKVFQAEPNQRMPEDLARKVRSKRRIKFSPYYLAILFILIILILIEVFSHPKSNTEEAALSLISPQAPTGTAILALNQVTQEKVNLLASGTQTPLPKPSLFPTPPPTETPVEIREGHFLEKPFGKDYCFVVHQVISGESLLFLATQTNTTPDVIKAINYHLIVPIWIDSIIILPIDLMDVDDLPAFQAYQVTESNLTLQQVAVRFTTNLDDLVYYNDIAAEETLIIGEWLIIPRARDQQIIG